MPSPPLLNQIPLPHPTRLSLPNHNPLTAPTAPLPRCSLPKFLYTRSPTQSVSTDASKVAFAALFMRDYAATWCQPYLNRIFNGEPLDWTDFLKDLEASFFDHNCQQRAEVALGNIHCVKLYAGLQPACPCCWVAQHPAHESLLKRTQ
ncbi:uncharacterized protein VP01_13842g1 [Puccinia sorghi]|uniref:Retrotransposon gag domain-containing protein n=1 Tax=Puccinia sorghi TaxID=27349 RepID=A0A0L6VLB0_9BASI|nr:uncharacterized protein VP01_13842g1 [Puccinia sorghi]